MISKTAAHQYYFEVELKRKAGRIGTLSADDILEVITVSTPPAFTGGVAGMWSPEHLFLSSLCSCLMATYLAFAEKRKLDVAHFECNAIGQVELVEGHLEFTTVNLFPKVFVHSEGDIAIANEILLKAYAHCIIANSIKSHLVHHGEVLLNKPVDKALFNE
jgi:organic hydroperoxide reductase OsmC/OhrA